MKTNSDGKRGKLGYFLYLCKDKAKRFWSWYKHLYIHRPWYTKTIAVICTLIVSFVLYLGAVDCNFLWLFGKSPGYFSGLLNPQTSQASEIYSADGVLIGKYFNENRTPVKFEEVNPIFWKTLVDTEDERYYTRPRGMAIDPIGMFAAAKDALLHHDARGASTITQQLAKNMFRVRTQYSTGLLGMIPGLRILIMKSKEWIIATKLEMCYNKEEIITMYANTVDFGSNAYGIKTACKTYFGNSPKEMTTDQAAILVGMLKATTFYNPIANPDNCIKRRNTVLSNLLSHKGIDQTAYDSLIQKPIKLDYSVETNYDGQAKYFREAVANYLKEWCRDNDYDLYNSGLKIYTTIDTRMQKYAEKAAVKQMSQVQKSFNSHWGKTNPWQDENGVEIPQFIEGIAQKLPVYKALVQRFPNDPDSVMYYMNKPHKVKLFDYAKGGIEKEISTMDSIRYMEHFLHCGFVAMEPGTGYVKAWVGDVDFDTWKYDKVNSMRQPGSTFKLFVYTEAMNQGLTPCNKERDQFISMQVYDKFKQREVTWTPSNANGRFSGDSVTLKAAFAQSINSIAVQIGQKVGIANIINTAHGMGIASPLDETPSLALGSSDVNLLELVNAYSTIVNDGKMHEPVLVTRIVDSEGNEVYVAPSEQKQAVPYKSAYLMQQMLLGGMSGTSQRLNSWVGNFRDTDFGGKTGTTNNHSDAWFIGVSPKLVCGAWVGGEYRCIHFRTGALGQGNRTALPICGYFLQSLLSDPNFQQYHAKFAKAKDEDILASMYNCSSYYAPKRHVDSTRIDTIMHDDEMIELDENGEPITTHHSSSESTTPNEESNTHEKTTKPEAPEKKKKAQWEDVTM